MTYFQLKLNQNTKNYLYSLRPYVLFCSVIFVLSVFLGYSAACNYSQEIQKVLREIKEMWMPFQEATSLKLFIFIAFNNISKIALVVFLGIISGIFPILFLFVNGIVVGIFAYTVAETVSWQMFLVGILPHGVIEIPVLILGAASGVKLGGVVFNKIFRKRGNLREEFSLALEFFLRILLPLLILAAVIEAFVTANLVR